MLDLLFGILQLLSQRVQAANRVLAAHFPGMIEHVSGDAHKLRVGRHLLQQCAELAFDLIAADALAVMFARIVVAEIIRVVRAAPF
nr:hypothetical protein [Hyphomonas sp.]